MVLQGGLVAAAEPAWQESDDIRNLIEQLGAPSFEQRQQASQTVVRVGAAAIPMLVSALDRPDPESRIRIIRVLAELAVCDHEATREQAQQAISILSESPDADIARLAACSLDRFGEQMQTAALERLRSLGATVSLDMVYGDFASLHGASVVIGPDWRGSQKDLDSLRWIRDLVNVTLIGPRIDDSITAMLAGKSNIANIVIKRATITNGSIQYLVQSPNLQKLQLIYCNIDDGCYDDLARIRNNREAYAIASISISLYGSRFSREAADRFEAETGIRIDLRNGAFLGVYFSPGDVPCVITRVVGNSAADRAGIEVGDRILEFAGREVRAADDFRGAVAGYVPGDEIEMVVERDEKPITLKIVLGEFQDLEQ
jgi:hypothetical protein